VTSRNNAWLRVNAGVGLTELIDGIITRLDPEFHAANLVAFVTSGVRSASGQLELLIRLALQYGIDKEFPLITAARLDTFTSYAGREVYTWQPAWSRLLNKGIIVNPPVPAAVLMDYWRDGVNKKGLTINTSPHLRGTAFDIGGGADGSIENETEVVRSAVDAGRFPEITNLVLERKQNCLHVDCRRTPPAA
jgi:hypothetical protein